jgi:phosphate uptake regulator
VRQLIEKKEAYRATVRKLEKKDTQLEKKRPKAEDKQEAQYRKLEEQCPVIEIGRYYWSEELRRFITELI